MRRREWAWLVALVLVMELVLFACTCVQVVDHCCPADAPCAICNYIYSFSRNVGELPLTVMLALIAVFSLVAAHAAFRICALNSSLILKKVRLND